MNMSILRAGIICISTIVSFASTELVSMDLTRTKRKQANQTSEQPAKKIKTTHNPAQKTVNQGPKTAPYAAQVIVRPNSAPVERMATDHVPHQYQAQQQSDIFTPLSQRYEQKQNIVPASVVTLKPLQTTRPRIATAVFEIDPAADQRLFERYALYAEQQRLNSSQNS